MENKPWCVDPFIQMAHTADGFYRVCCIGEVDRSAAMNTQNMTPLEFFNSGHMQQVRADMLKNDPDQFTQATKHSCGQCISNTHSKITHRRIQENDMYSDYTHVADNVRKHNNGESYIYEDLLYVNFKVLGNICNLKCIMCGPSASSKIAAERKKFFTGDADNYVELNPFDTNNREQYFDEIDKIISSVNKFNLVGGENMIHPDFVSLFERFINNPNAKNLNLTIITNGTMVPPIVLDNAHRFNSVSMLCSIDGVAERGAYVRSGLKWNTFDKNIRIYQNHPHISTSFLVATQMLNIGYLGDIYDYLVYDLGIPYKRINWNNVVTSPAKWRAVNLPDHIKAKYLEKLKKHEISQLNWLPYDRIEQILLSPQGSNDEFLKGIQELKTLDAVRNSYMPLHFPELDEYYQLAPEPKIKLLR